VRIIAIFLIFTFVFACGEVVAEASPTEAGTLSHEDFTSYSTCNRCHAITTSQWEGSMHYHAFDDPFYQEELKLASEETNGSLDVFCTRCHIPASVVSGQVPPINNPDISEEAAEGVGCDFCHSVKESSEIGNGGYAVTPSETKYGPFEDSESAFHEAQYSEFYTKSEYCGMCHQITHPTSGVVLDDTYQAWSESPYAEEKVQCQDCHMTPGITEFEANPGRAGSGAPKRDHISVHNFAGANVFVTGILDEDDHKEMAIERLQEAATLEIDIPENAQPGEEVAIKVSITNSGAGHNLPTGLTEARQMWTQVDIKDSQGREIYSSGNLDINGTIEDSIVYQAIYADASGEPTLKLWEITDVISDNRIAPTSTATEIHNFTIPTDATNPIIVDTKLLYRSAPQHLIDELFEQKEYEVPIVEMESVKGGINGEVESEGTPGFGSVVGLIALLTIYLFRRNM